MKLRSYKIPISVVSGCSPAAVSEPTHVCLARERLLVQNRENTLLLLDFYTENELNGLVLG